MNQPQNIGLELRIARTRAQKTMRQVGAEIGVSEATISLIENNLRPVSGERLQALMAATCWTPTIRTIVDEIPSIPERMA